MKCAALSFHNAKVSINNTTWSFSSCKIIKIYHNILKILSVKVELIKININMNKNKNIQPMPRQI